LKNPKREKTHTSSGPNDGATERGKRFKRSSTSLATQSLRKSLWAKKMGKGKKVPEQFSLKKKGNGEGEHRLRQNKGRTRASSKSSLYLRERGRGRNTSAGLFPRRSSKKGEGFALFVLQSKTKKEGRNLFPGLQRGEKKRQARPKVLSLSLRKRGEERWKSKKRVSFPLIPGTKKGKLLGFKPGEKGKKGKRRERLHRRKEEGEGHGSRPASRREIGGREKEKGRWAHMTSRKREGRRVRFDS